jgi:hypothetical protein
MGKFILEPLAHLDLHVSSRIMSMIGIWSDDHPYQRSLDW